MDNWKARIVKHDEDAAQAIAKICILINYDELDSVRQRAIKTHLKLLVESTQASGFARLAQETGISVPVPNTHE